MTLSQLEASAHAPCTSTIVGLVELGLAAIVPGGRSVRWRRSGRLESSHDQSDHCGLVE